MTFSEFAALCAPMAGIVHSVMALGFVMLASGHARKALRHAEVHPGGLAQVHAILAGSLMICASVLLTI